MPETMTEPTVEVPPQAPTCATQKCKRPLTWLGPPQNCWRCLVCNPITEIKPTEERKRKYIGVAMTEEMVIEIIKEQIGSAQVTNKKDEDEIREIVQDELANWHIPKPSVTATEVAEIVEAIGSADGQTTVQKVVKPETWLQKAKRLGVRTHNEGTGGMRKKIDIMADMEAKERETDAQIPEELRTEEQG